LGVNFCEHERLHICLLSDPDSGNVRSTAALGKSAIVVNQKLFSLSSPRGPMSPDPPHPNNFGCHSNGDTNLNLPTKLLIKWKTLLKVGFWNISVFHIPTAPKSRTPPLLFESFAFC